MIEILSNKKFFQKFFLHLKKKKKKSLEVTNQLFSEILATVNKFKVAEIHIKLKRLYGNNYSLKDLGPEHTGHFVQPHVAAHCGGDIYSRRKPLFSSFGEHTAVCGSSVRQAVARPRHRQSVCIHNIHVAATCRPSVLGSATMRGHMWLNKVASVLGPLKFCDFANTIELK